MKMGVLGQCNSSLEYSSFRKLAEIKKIGDNRKTAIPENTIRTMHDCNLQISQLIHVKQIYATMSHLMAFNNS